MVNGVGGIYRRCWWRCCNCCACLHRSGQGHDNRLQKGYVDVLLLKVIEQMLQGVTAVRNWEQVRDNAVQRDALQGRGNIVLAQIHLDGCGVVQRWGRWSCKELLVVLLLLSILLMLLVIVGEMLALIVKLTMVARGVCWLMRRGMLQMRNILVLEIRGNMRSMHTVVVSADCCAVGVGYWLQGQRALDVWPVQRK